MTQVISLLDFHPLARIAREDGRYDLQAYVFVFESLRYAQSSLGWGVPPEEDWLDDEGVVEDVQEIDMGPLFEFELLTGDTDEEAPRTGRHLTGQELCRAMRLLALEQFGYMARCVLAAWGVNSTGDFGEIVYNLIRAGKMRKTKDDRREHFDAVFDFDRDLREVEFELPEEC